MIKNKFDSSQILPLFQIISPNNKTENMNTTESSIVSNQKHKRKVKKPEVLVHKSQSSAINNNVPIHKTFSANFRSQNHDNIESRTAENDSLTSNKIKRRHLIKENDRIVSENQKLHEQLILTHNALSKRESQLVKMKDKLSCVQLQNEKFIHENNIIKTQYEDILINLEEFKNQLAIKIKCKMCEDMKQMLKKQLNDLEVSKNDNKGLIEDLNMLKNVVYRLNVQLERYQQKLQKSVNSNSNLELTTIDTQNNISNIIDPASEMDHDNHLHTPISWGSVNTHTLGPLLDAYQDTIKEKEEIIKNYETEFVNFGGKLKMVTEENEKLHKLNEESCKMVEKLGSDLENDKQEVKMLREQNDLLIKKCALKHDKLQEICKVYDHKIENMKRDYEVLQDQFHKTRMELNSLQGKYQSLTDVNDSLKFDKQNVIPLSVHTTSVNECKRLFEELKTQYDIEKTKLNNQIKLLEQQIETLQTKLNDIHSEKHEFLAKIKTTEKQIKKLEQKLEETKNSLKHTQISRDACKRQLTRAIEFARELINEQELLLKQLSTHQKENKAVKTIGSNIISRMDLLKTQLKSVQKDAFLQLASVEQRIQKQDSSLESMRKDHENEVEKLLQEIQNKDKFISKLISENNVPSTPYLLYKEKHLNLS